MDYLTKDIQTPLPWCILYADDIVLINKSVRQLQTILGQWRQALERNGLRISRCKTEHLECKFSSDTTISNRIYIEGDQLPKVSQFKYLGTMLTADGAIESDVTYRVNAGWQRWRALSGVLCDRKMLIKVKGKVYKTAVRPAMMYGVRTKITCGRDENAEVGGRSNKT
ncbi:uncharacterized protein LOC133517485 [Cydia pomonella]|uniref:uncharacterized protein LOC133517485 n=1 Tax=Cydia pomonella TaxID=82600 RepID=UPI002ADDD3B3|nr:uncharacterized protein LOC133517485 [Cydia pomonella]